jgi:hypothetical protein
MIRIEFVRLDLIWIQVSKNEPQKKKKEKKYIALKRWMFRSEGVRLKDKYIVTQLKKKNFIL